MCSRQGQHHHVSAKLAQHTPWRVRGLEQTKNLHLVNLCKLILLLQLVLQRSDAPGQLIPQRGFLMNAPVCQRQQLGPDCLDLDLQACAHDNHTARIVVHGPQASQGLDAQLQRLASGDTACQGSVQCACRPSTRTSSAQLCCMRSCSSSSIACLPLPSAMPAARVNQLPAGCTLLGRSLPALLVLLLPSAHPQLPPLLRVLLVLLSREGWRWSNVCRLLCRLVGLGAR